MTTQNSAVTICGTPKAMTGAKLRQECYVAFSAQKAKINITVLGGDNNGSVNLHANLVSVDLALFRDELLLVGIPEQDLGLYKYDPTLGDVAVGIVSEVIPGGTPEGGTFETYNITFVITKADADDPTKDLDTKAVTAIYRTPYLGCVFELSPGSSPNVDARTKDLKMMLGIS